MRVCVLLCALCFPLRPLMMAAGRASRQLAILRRSDDLRDDLFASRTLLPEREEEFNLAVAGIPLQKRFKESLDLVGPILRAGEYDLSHLQSGSAPAQQAGEGTQSALVYRTAEEVNVKPPEESVVRPAATILVILGRDRKSVVEGKWGEVLVTGIVK